MTQQLSASYQNGQTQSRPGRAVGQPPRHDSNPSSGPGARERKSHSARRPDVTHLSESEAPRDKLSQHRQFSSRAPALLSRYQRVEFAYLNGLRCAKIAGARPDRRRANARENAPPARPRCHSGAGPLRNRLVAVCLSAARRHRATARGTAHAPGSAHELNPHAGPREHLATRPGARSILKWPGAGARARPGLLHYLPNPARPSHRMRAGRPAGPSQNAPSCQPAPPRNSCSDTRRAGGLKWSAGQRQTDPRCRVTSACK